MNHRAALLISVVATACGSSQPTNLATVDLNGNHPLIAYGGQSLPARLGEIPATRLGGHSGCFDQLQSGNLHLSIRDGSGLFYESDTHTNSCTGEKGATYGWSGQVTATRDVLFFKSTGADGFVATDAAHVISGRIVFDQREPSLAYTLDAAP